MTYTPHIIPENDYRPKDTKGVETSGIETIPKYLATDTAKLKFSATSDDLLTTSLIPRVNTKIQYAEIYLKNPTASNGTNSAYVPLSLLFSVYGGSSQKTITQLIPETVTTNITSASSTSSRLIYTVNSVKNFAVGQQISVTGVTPVAYQVTDAYIVSIGSNTISVASTANPGNSTAGGTMAVTDFIKMTFNLGSQTIYSSYLYSLVLISGSTVSGGESVKILGKYTGCRIAAGSTAEDQTDLYVPDAFNFDFQGSGSSSNSGVTIFNFIPYVFFRGKT